MDVTSYHTHEALHTDKIATLLKNAAEVFSIRAQDMQIRVQSTSGKEVSVEFKSKCGAARYMAGALAGYGHGAHRSQSSHTPPRLAEYDESSIGDAAVIFKSQHDLAVILNGFSKCQDERLDASALPGAEQQAQRA